jgi:hypothetical protein
VTVVLVLPPRDRETLHQITPEKTVVVSVPAVAKDLVMQEVMCQPAALLEEKSHKTNGEHLDCNIVREVHEKHRSCPHGNVRKLLVDVEPIVGLEHAHDDQLGSQISVGLLEISLLVVLVFDAFYNEFADEELLHHSLGARRMKGGKDICHVISGVSEDDGTTRMLIPARYVVNFVVVHHPGIRRGTVLLYLSPCELGVCLGHLASILRGPCSNFCFSSFAHGCCYLFN